ncbi:hypothetical protein BLA29_014337, partial [Euroglyphus maynei]
IIEEKSDEDVIRTEIEETKLDVKTVKKTVKKTKRKESVTEEEEEKDKDITDETQVTVTEEIIELPGEEEKPEKMIKEKDEGKLEDDKPKKHSKKVIRRKSKPEFSEEKFEEPKSVVIEELIELKP